MIEKIVKVQTTIVTNVFSNFFKFLQKKNIIILALAYIVANNISDFTTEFVKTIIAPIINRIFGTTYDTLDTKTWTILGIHFQIGAFITSLIQFTILLYIVYILYTISS